MFQISCGFALDEGVIGAAQFCYVGVDIVRADTKNRRSTPLGQFTVLGRESIWFKIGKFAASVDIGDDSDHPAFHVPFRRPHARDTGHACLHSRQIGPVDQVRADSNAEMVLGVAAAGGHRIGVGDVVLPVGVLHDAGIANVAGIATEPSVRQQREGD